MRKVLAVHWRTLKFLDGYLLWLRFWMDMSFPEIVELPEFKAAPVTKSALKCRISRRCYGTLRPVLSEFSPCPHSKCKEKAKCTRKGKRKRKAQ